jgi:hypothetical protein
MRQFVIAAVSVATIVVLAGSADAAPRRYYRPARTAQWSGGQYNGGFFGRLMELERRKNQWLFGR